MEKGVDTFFTLPEVAAFCISKCKERGWITEETRRVLEPSSGDGVFYDQMPNKAIMTCLDIQPQHPEAIQCDFLEWDGGGGEVKFDLIIGNPPFGKRNKTAHLFFAKAAKFSNRVAFILPKSFLRPATIDRIDRNFWPSHVDRLPTENFRIPGGKLKMIGCVWMMWERRDMLRPLISKSIGSKYDIKSTMIREEAEYCLCHSGPNTGKILPFDSYIKGTCFYMKGLQSRVSETDWSQLIDNAGTSIKYITIQDIRLAFYMIDAGLDYTTGAIGYLNSLK